MQTERPIFSREERCVYSETRDLAERGASFREFLERWQALSPSIRTVANRGWRGGSVCLNSFGRFTKWISASIMQPPSLMPAR